MTSSKTVKAVFEKRDPNQYTLTVHNGTGSGKYGAGEVVPITATVPDNKFFSEWTVDTENVADPHARQTTVTMKADTMVTATFTNNPLPNLRPAKPDSSWSDKIVASHWTGTTQDDAVFSGDHQVFVDWACINDGNASAGPFTIRLLVDGIQQAEESVAGLAPGATWSKVDSNIGQLAQRDHVIKVVVDVDEEVEEDHESDNEHSKTITVIGGVKAYPGPDKVIPYGNSTKLEGEALGGIPPYTYAWAPPTGLDRTDVPEPNASPLATTMYSLTVKDALGATHTDQVQVSVGAWIKVSAPLAGASFATGTGTFLGEWQSGGVPGGVRIDIVNVEGAMVCLLENYANTGSYSLSLGPPLGNFLIPRSGLRLSVSDFSNPAVFGLSPSSFTITGALPNDRVVVNAPNGGETWRNGEQHTILWNSYGTVGERVEMLIYSDGRPIGPIYDAEDNDPANTGSFSWAVGDVSGRSLPVGTKYQLQIRGTSDGHIQDFSNSYFSISD